MLVGLTINPFFPENARFDVTQALVPLTLGRAIDLYGPMEMKPITWEWIAPSQSVVVVWIAALIAAGWQRGRKMITPSTLLLLAMSGAALLASLRVGRTFDYFVPLAVLFSAAALSPWIVKNRRALIDASAVATVILVLCGFNVVAARKAVRKAPPAGRLRGVAEYLRAHTPSTVVFNTQWEQYPFLYFWNSDNTYVAGIDPSMMYYQDPRRYWLWRHIANDELETCDRSQCSEGNSRSIPLTIQKEFGAQFVVIEHERNPRLEQTLQRAITKEAYRDAVCSLFSLGDVPR
jgi:hypothetical protein